jgi:transcriptional regulator with XRE-family HTH domain
MTLGDKLKQIRGALSQAEFAVILGVSQPTIGKYEKGVRVPDTDFIQSICSNFGISADWLILGDEKAKTADVGSFDRQGLQDDENLSETGTEKEKNSLTCQRNSGPQNIQYAEIIESERKKFSDMSENFKEKYFAQLEENNRLLRDQLALERELTAARSRIAELERKPAETEALELV